MGTRQGGCRDTCPGTHGQSMVISWVGHARLGHRHWHNVTPSPPAKGQQWDRSAGRGGGADTQLLSLLSHRFGNALGSERGLVRTEDLQVRVVASRLPDWTHLVLLENDLVPRVHQGCEQQEKYGLSAQDPSPYRGFGAERGVCLFVLTNSHFV